ncbi:MULTISPECIES: tetratricopeptide repeat protein [Bacillus]|uniref:tetratricopeptide repeat protein n=1 Tax=Bacillus TaxID=1386 RepID=UPI00159B8931|nr:MULTISPECIES: tetratricopeptide repeat protein [Bacillus]KAF6700421.1 tetratricopeptide repeat protein [Bacillus sp. EKM501B]
MDQIDIRHQEAQRDIYNVAGNLTVNNYYLDSQKKILPQNAFNSSTKFIKYVDNLNDSFKDKRILDRKSYYQELECALNEDNQVLIFGEPGVGKTAILNQLSLQKESIYVSMKSMSALRVLHYLINEILLQKGLEQYNDPSIENSIVQFEELLAETTILFLIDDCEINKEFVARLIDLEKFRNNFIFVSRTNNILSKLPIQSIRIHPLNEEEVGNFLKLHGLELPTTVLIEVIDSSNGNPLYLYYFVKHQVFPIPKGLQAYQEAIWNSLNDIQKSILSSVSLCLFPLKFEILNLTINKLHKLELNPIELNKEISNVDTLLYINEGAYELFHPFFSDFIKAKLEASGLSTWYQNEIGEIFFEKQNYIEAIPLLININADKVFDELLSVAPYYVEWGYFDLTISVLQKFITLSENKMSIEVGYANYHLSNCYRNLGYTDLMRVHIDNAINIFHEINEQDWLSVSLIWKALDLADEGKIEEAHNLSSEIFSQKPSNEHIEATLLINMSKLYIDTLEFEKGAEVSKEAFGLFKKYNDSKGLISSLVNLSVCLVKLDQLEVALEYCNSLLEVANNNGDEILSATVLNTMTICHRKLGNTNQAKEYCNQCIRIWGRQNQKQKLAMNILNLGNVYRDERDFQNAEKYYREGLALAIEVKSLKEQGRAYELLANIFREQERYDESISYATLAIDNSKAAGDKFRVAEAFIEKAISEEEKKQYNVSIGSYQEAINYYYQSNTYDEMMVPIINVIRLYEKLNCYEKLNDQIQKIYCLFENGVLTANIEGVEELLNYIPVEKVLNFYTLLFEKTIEKQIYITSSLVINFISICKRHIQQGKIHFNKFCEQLIDHIDVKRYQNLLAHCIEQSSILLNHTELLHLFKRLTDNLQGIYFRELTDEDLLVTLSWTSQKMFQIRAHKNCLQELKVGIAIAIILKANEDIFNKCIKSYKEENLSIHVINQSIFSENIMEIPIELINHEIPAIFLRRMDFNIFQPIILLDEYSKLNDFTLNPQNKAFAWVLLMLFNIVYSHFTHSDLDIAENQLYRKSFLYRVLDLFKLENAIDNLNNEKLKFILNDNMHDLIKHLK